MTKRRKLEDYLYFCIVETIIEYETEEIYPPRE